MIVLLDHHDSFIDTLARYVRELGETAAVLRAGTWDIEGVAAMQPTHVILSPGPGRPYHYPETVAAIRALGPQLPILGVCLGHQCIAAAYGAVVRRTAHPQHGRGSPILHDSAGVYLGLPNPLFAGRYHSLAVQRNGLPDALVLTATAADDGDVMGIRHRHHPVEGVQFHPESILTEWGHAMLANFLGRARNGLTPKADGVRL
jgi:anthranilate synthase/aminodeoxychorismate synthase-like glutamine amidotransferase